MLAEFASATFTLTVAHVSDVTENFNSDVIENTLIRGGVVLTWHCRRRCSCL